MSERGDDKLATEIFSPSHFCPTALISLHYLLKTKFYFRWKMLVFASVALMFTFRCMVFIRGFLNTNNKAEPQQFPSAAYFYIAT